MQCTHKTFWALSRGLLIAFSPIKKILFCCCYVITNIFRLRAHVAFCVRKKHWMRCCSHPIIKLVSITTDRSCHLTCCYALSDPTRSACLDMTQYSIFTTTFCLLAQCLNCVFWKKETHTKNWQSNCTLSTLWTLPGAFHLKVVVTVNLHLLPLNATSSGTFSGMAVYCRKWLTWLVVDVEDGQRVEVSELSGGLHLFSLLKGMKEEE